MRGVVLAVVALVGTAHAGPQPWSVDITYRGTASITTAGDKDVPSAYASSLVAHIEHTTGRWFYGAVLAMGIPGTQGQGESSVTGGLHHMLHDGACFHGPDGTELHCGPTLRLDYAIDMGVTMAMRIPEMENKGLEYYGPAIRPRVSFHTSWPMRSGKQIGLTATLGLASVLGTDMAMKIADQKTTFRLEPSLELGGSIKF